MKPRKIFTVIKSFLRGAVKSFPVGNAIIEGVENVKAKSVLDSTEENIKNEIEKIEKPHNWVSIITQLSLTALFIYLFFTKQITVEKLEELLKYFN